MEDFKAQFEASQAELANLRSILEQYQANKQAIEGTVNDLLAANINLKASEILSGNNIGKLKAEIASLKAEIDKLKPESEPEKAQPADEMTDAA